MEKINKNQEEKESLVEKNGGVAELHNKVDGIESIAGTVEGISENILERFIPSNSRGITKSFAKGGGVSIVNAKTGKRISVNKAILDYLKVEDKIQFAFSDNEIAIGKELPNNENYFNIKMSNTKGLVYCTSLVLEVTELYGLDFQNRTSITFDDIQYQNIQGNNVVIVKVN